LSRAGAGHAQAKYPDRPVKVLIGFTAGGGTDVAGRLIAQKLSRRPARAFVSRTGPAPAD
jgi:tripartite-type tricarboxylate transporter receptor subunit TctC